MDDSAGNNWEAVYERGEDWGASGPSEYVRAAVPHLKSGATVLDVGCGVGRNALYLAELGFTVEAFDISSVAIKKVQREAKAKSIATLISYQADFRYWQRRERYDFVVLHGVLNSIQSELRPALLQHLRKRINYGGMIFISAFHPLPSETKLAGVFVFEDVSSEFIQEKAFYGYETKRHDIRVFGHRHGNLPDHNHCIERFLFRKPLAETCRLQSSDA